MYLFQAVWLAWKMKLPGAHRTHGLDRSANQRLRYEVEAAHWTHRDFRTEQVS